jgi:hypothetical protein
LDIKGQEHQQDIEKIKLFRYMDDDFMTVCLEDNYEGVELILQIWIFERLIVPPKNMI